MDLMKNKFFRAIPLIISTLYLTYNIGVGIVRSEPKKEKVKHLNNPLSLILSFRNNSILYLKKDLNKEKKTQLDNYLENYLKKSKINSVEKAIRFSLDFVAANLEFRSDYFLGKKGIGYYYFPKGIKNTDCRDYAFLFDKTLEYVVKKTNLGNIKCDIMRSKDVYFLGHRVDDHDWDKITDVTQGRVWLVDPTFYDCGFPHNLEGIIK